MAHRKNYVAHRVVLYNCVGVVVVAKKHITLRVKTCDFVVDLIYLQPHLQSLTIFVTKNKRFKRHIETNCLCAGLEKNVMRKIHRCTFYVSTCVCG